MELEFQNINGMGQGLFLKDISFTVRDGFITGLVGKNGAGKTTLFSTVMNMDAKYRGTILVDGQSLREHRELRNRIGFISEEQSFFLDKTAKENGRLFSTMYDIFDEEKYAENLNRLEVPGGRTVGKMSRGEKIKMQMAFAIAHDAKLYLLDEVTAGMDPVFRKDFFKLLHELIAEEDVAILMSTHIEDEVRIHMDYVAVLDDGELLSFGEEGIQDGNSKTL